MARFTGHVLVVGALALLTTGQDLHGQTLKRTTIEDVASGKLQPAYKAPLTPLAPPSLLAPTSPAIAGHAAKAPVEGLATSTTLTDGLYGEARNAGYAGVRGSTASAGGFGVVGENAATGARGRLASGNAGVEGQATSGLGVYGSAVESGVGVFGRSGSRDGAGVVGQGSAPGAAGVQADGSGPSGTALRLGPGAVRVTGMGVNTPTSVFVLEATPANMKDQGCGLTNSGRISLTNQVSKHWACSGTVVIDHPMLNGDPSAVVFMSPQNLTSPYEMFVGPRYDPGLGRWTVWIFDDYVGCPESATTCDVRLPLGTRMNMLVFKQ